MTPTAGSPEPADFGHLYWRTSPAARETLPLLSPHAIDDATFRLVADNVPTLCWVANGDGYIVWYNRQWHAYCGTTPAQMEGWGWQSVHDPDLLPSVLESWTASLATGEPFEMTFPLKGADGRFRPFLTRVQPMRDASGEVARWFGVNTEISDQVAAEAALRCERDRSRGVLEGMAEAFMLLDRDFRVLDVNNEGLRLKQRPRSAILGESHWRAWPGSEQGDIGSLYRQVMASGAPGATEFHHRGADGEEAWIEVRAYPHPEGLAVFHRDISGRKRAETQLRASEAFTRLLLNSTSEAFYSLDTDGVTTLCNQAFLDVLGFARMEDVVGRKLHDVIHHSHPDGSHYATQDCPIYRAARLGTAGHVTDEVFFRQDGTTVPVEYRAEPILRDGKLVGAICTFADITERRRAEEALRDMNETLARRVEDAVAERARVEDALRQAQKMEAVGQLTGGIAHDFNNMLAVIMGSLDLLGRRINTDDPRARLYVDAALDGARRATLLTQRLLAFSRQQPLRPESVDVNKLVSGMSDLLRRSLGGDVRLETVLAGGIWRTHADPNQLENAILNLAVNARDAMPEGGRLTIETQNAHLDEAYVAQHPGMHAGQYVLIAVTDTGCGMQPDVIAKAFDPFFTTKEVGRGTGLGLSQVYGFVRQSGGHIKIYSEPGQGTTLKAYLPRLFGASAEPEEQEREGQVPGGEKQECILVVEDEPAVRRFSVDALNELGYDVLEADGAAAALRMLEAYPGISVLFTDVVMPEVNGRKLADEALRRRPGLRVLFTTGYTRSAVVHNGVLDPDVQMIGKPFTVEQLALKMRAVLDGPESHADRPGTPSS